MCIQWNISQPQKERSYDVGYKIEEPWKRWNKPDAEEQISYYSSYMKYVEQASS